MCADANQVGKKRCYACGQTKDRSDYRNNAHQHDGLRSECRACHQLQKYAARRAGKEKKWVPTR